ncbi:MAG: hypothetical protein II288_00165, partial [Alistipes sp.]|nr:hypothetical protein [Alistipes sp.]
MRRLSALIIATIASITLLSAQSNYITPIPVSTNTELGSFDASEQLKLYIGVEGADYDKLVAAAHATGLDLKAVKSPAKSRYLNL